MATVRATSHPKVPRIPSITDIDPQVMKDFPEGSKCIESVVYGTAAWTNAQRITIQVLDGSAQSFFLKSGSGEKGKNMMEAEYLGVRELNKFMPDFVPTPFNWGKFERSDTYFFYMEFLDVSQQELPEPGPFCAKLAELHNTSVSPTGKFGFYRSTFQGPLKMLNDWDDSWCSFLTRLLTRLFENEVSENGPYPEMEAAFELFITETIKLVLEPLQSDGRTLKPSLIHGDMWEENAAINLATNDPVVYDCTAMYAHNEFEIGMWRGESYLFGQTYFREYLACNPPSEPIEQFNDRNRIYSMKHTLVRVTNYPNQPDRDLLRSDLEYLNEKYGVSA